MSITPINIANYNPTDNAAYVVAAHGAVGDIETLLTTAEPGQPRVLDRARVTVYFTGILGVTPRAAYSNTCVAGVGPVLVYSVDGREYELMVRHLEVGFHARDSHHGRLCTLTHRTWGDFPERIRAMIAAVTRGD